MLALRALGLGDLLTALPALRGLRAATAGERLVLAAPAWLEPVALLSGAVDGVLDTAPLGPVAGWPPRLAVNLHGRGPESTRRLRELGSPEIWAYDAPDAPGWDDGEHEVLRWCRLLEAHGVGCDPTALSLPHPGVDAPTAGLTLVHPGGAASSRRWPASRWSAVAEALAGRGHRVAVTGSGAEVDLCRAVAAGAGLPADAVLAGRLDLDELCATVACSRLVLCADTGVGHLATAYSVPSVVLFGPVPPSVWGPPPGEPRHRALGGAAPSDPAADGPAPALLAVGADDVLAAAEAVLG